MMSPLFGLYLVFSVLGGTVFVVQFVLALIGFGADDLDIVDDIPDDVPDDLPHDVSQAGSVADHGSTWLFGVLSFRSVVAALAFFGLGGIAAIQAGMHPVMSLVVAAGCGLAAMYGVHFLMRSLHRLRHDGTLRIERSLGHRGTVYVPIPPQEQGAGQVQLRMQGRIVEFAAVTPGPDKLRTGTTVVVTDVISPTTLRVEPVGPAVAAKEPAQT